MRQTKYERLRPTMRRNLLRLYRRATPADLHEGRAWYSTAVRGCLAWSQQFEVDERVIACVIAAISPQCDWTTNLRIAFELLSGQTIVSGGALRANVDKAKRVLADRSTTLETYFVGGPKVRAFAANLQGNADAVTIDGHAVQAACNDVTVTNGLHPPQYATVADVYRQCAAVVGERPCDFQAIIWCAWKRRYSPERKRAIIRKGKARVR